MTQNNSRKWPTGLPLVDSLRSCMLQRVPDGAMPSRVSSLPYDAAELIHDLYDALEQLNAAIWRCVDCAAIEGTPVEEASLKARAAIAKARDEQVPA